MDHIQKVHTSAFTKHLLVCDLAIGFEFLKQIQVNYDMDSEPKLFIEKLQMLVSAQVSNEVEGVLVETLEPIWNVEGSGKIPKTRILEWNF